MCSYLLRFLAAHLLSFSMIHTAYSIFNSICWTIPFHRIFFITKTLWQQWWCCCCQPAFHFKRKWYLNFCFVSRRHTHTHTHTVGVGRCHSYRFVCLYGQWTHMCRMHYEWRNAVDREWALARASENGRESERKCDTQSEMLHEKEKHGNRAFSLHRTNNLMYSSSTCVYCIMYIHMHCLLCVICMQAINSQSRIEAYQCSPRMKSKPFPVKASFSHINMMWCDAMRCIHTYR